MIWVFAQLILFALYVLLPDSKNFDYFAINQVLGPIMAVTGLFIGARAAYDLRKSLSVAPRPTPGSSLIQAGIYGYIRHPMYTAVWLTTGGYAAFDGSLTKMIMSAILVVFFVLKSRHEEKLLMARYKDYDEYSKCVGAFWPKKKAKSGGP
ncbi:MAG: isoprenylcysteine carboxylmethyltransferase family protein [Candidatus Saccharimonadales bacterium]|nr:isoprenylcysteine carboxylmethyltransferase family protein [Candidatus Saccharimonadales bacterium]